MRCKMRLNVKTVHEYPSGKQTEVEFMAVSAGSEEDKKFFEATPSGSIKLSVLNHAAVEHLQPGKSYYVDFAEAAE